MIRERFLQPSRNSALRLCLAFSFLGLLLSPFAGFVTAAFADAPRIRTIVLRGENAIEEAALRKILGVRAGDRFGPGLCDRVEDRIGHQYQRFGYVHADVSCKFTPDEFGKGELLIKIEEGAPLVVKNVELPSDLPDDIRSIVKPFVQQFQGQTISERSQRDFARSILYELRVAGYIFASVHIDVNEEALSVQISPRHKVELRLHGNRAIPSSELVSLLKLDQRLSPFTRRSLENLRVLMQNYYEDRGYFLVGVSYEQKNDEGDKEIYQYNFDEGRKLFLESLELDGNSSLSSGEIKKVLTLKPRGRWFLSNFYPGILTRKQIAGDLLAVEELYRTKGFLDVLVNADPVLGEDPKGILLRFHISEGPRYQVEEIRESHDCQIVEPLLEPLQKLKGKTASDERIRAVKDETLQAFHKQGLATASFSLSYDKAARALSAEVHCGPQVHIGEVSITGLGHTKEWFVQGLLRFHSGDLWVPEVLQEAEGRLRESGIFSQVEIVPTDGTIDSAVENVSVKLAERDTGVLDSSVSFNTEDGLRIGGELTQRNLRGNGETVGFAADLFVNDQPKVFDAGRARAFVKIPTVFGLESTEFLAEGYAQYDIQNVNQFTLTRIGVDTQLREKLGKYLLSVGTSIFDDDVSDVPSDIQISDQDVGSTFYGFFTGKVEYDARDSSFLPTKGFYLSLAGKGSSEILGSQVNLVTGSFEAKHYLSLDDDLVWANGFRTTALQPYAGTDVVPLSQRLFLGGSTTLRGFGRNRLSPLGVDGDQAGGDADFVLNTELQYNLPSDIQLATFIDAGEVVLNHGGEALSDRSTDFRIAPGFGVRYRTPVGPLGLDLGFPVNPRAGESSPRLYFGFSGIF